jgi:thymidylate synthase
MIPTRVADIRRHFIVEHLKGNFVIDKTGVKTIEIVGANFTADQETIFGPVNDEYVLRELEWYKSRSLKVADIPGGAPKIWQQVASKSGFINSNYGWCIWDEDNHTQYMHVRNELYWNPNSRRAEMIYNRPSMWLDYNKDGMSDFMCTNAVQYLIRDHKLHAVVQMRSNDVVFGYRNDYAWQSYVLDMLLNDLNMNRAAKAFSESLEAVPYERGDITWQVGSLHIYERHFDLIK